MFLFNIPRAHEANTTFALGLALRDAGLKFCLEYTVPKVGRLDVVILREVQGKLYVVGIVEVKRNTRRKPYKKRLKEDRYRTLGVPVFVCDGNGRIPECLLWAKTLSGVLSSG